MSGWTVVQPSHLPPEAHQQCSVVAYKQQRGEMSPFATNPTHARSRMVLVKVCLVKYGLANNRRRKSLSCRMAWSGLKLYWLPCARRRHLACIARPDASGVDRRFRQDSKDDRERRDETKHDVNGSKGLFDSFVICLI